MKTLKLTRNLNYKPNEETEGTYPIKFICPITKVELNGSHPFVVIWSTGFVVAEKAIRELGIDSLQAEYGPFLQEDLVRVAPSEEEAEKQIEQMLERRRRARPSKRLLEVRGGSEEKAVDPLKRPLEGRGGTEEKEKEKERAAAKRTRPSGGGIAHSAGLVRAAAVAVAGQQESSQIFQTLFHKDLEKDKKDRDLFMSVAGLRYSI